MKDNKNELNADVESQHAKSNFVFLNNIRQSVIFTVQPLVFMDVCVCI